MKARSTAAYVAGIRKAAYARAAVSVPSTSAGRRPDRYAADSAATAGASSAPEPSTASSAASRSRPLTTTAAL